MAPVTYSTLEHVAMEARVYPAHVLEESRSGLCLFAAAFMGHNDAIHFAKAGIRTSCVDTDGDRLAEMRRLYPRDWEFVTADAWTFATAARELGAAWDAVSLDPFTGDTMDSVRASLETWTALANLVVVVGVDNEVPEAMIPAGWEATEYLERSAFASWLVLERSS